MQIPPASSLIHALSRLAETPRVERFADRLAEIGAKPVSLSSPATTAATAEPAPPAPAAPTPGEKPRPRGSVVDLVV
jgi:hypothetical protein